MNFIDKPGKLRGFEKNIRVEKVSRRSILKGLGVTGGFVLAAPVMSRQPLLPLQSSDNLRRGNSASCGSEDRVANRPLTPLTPFYPYWS